MNAQRIIIELNKINPDGLDTEVNMRAENASIVEEIFNLAGLVEPTSNTSPDTTWEFWLWTDKGSYEDYVEAHKAQFITNSIEVLLNGEEGIVDYETMKEKWPILFPKDTVWFRLTLVNRQDNHNKRISLDNREVVYTGENRKRPYDMSALLGWILEALKNCVDMIKRGTYTEYVEQSLPFRCRSGITKMATYWEYVPEDKERIFGEIDSKELEEFRKWDENEDKGQSQMTSNDYFGFCNTLYDLLDLKTRFPIVKSDSPSPKDYYMAYAANYDSSKPFKELEGDSPEAFDKFFEEGYIEHHTWEVCLAPNIHLYPVKVDGRYYISISFKRYAQLIHLALELRKHGVPVKKPSFILQEMEGEQRGAIVPDDGKYDYEYASKNRIRFNESRRLPRGVNEEVYREIEWFPIGRWRAKT